MKNKAKLFLIVSKWILGCVFLAASIPKIINPSAFALIVFRYHLLPYELVNIAAILLPWVESVCALALLGFRPFQAVASFIFLGLLIIFTSAVIINLFRGIDISCGCFSLDPRAHQIGWFNIIRNMVLIFLSIFVMISALKGRGGEGAKV